MCVSKGDKGQCQMHATSRSVIILLCPSCWQGRVMLSVGSHLRNQVGLVDTAFDLMFILVCAMWHNALLQQMGKFCISDNCRFLWSAITIKFRSEKLVSLSYDLRSRNKKWGCNISPTGTMDKFCLSDYLQLLAEPLHFLCVLFSRNAYLPTWVCNAGVHMCRCMWVYVFF